jgi:hypothetical protein
MGQAAIHTKGDAEAEILGAPSAPVCRCLPIAANCATNATAPPEAGRRRIATPQAKEVLPGLAAP